MRGAVLGDVARIDERRVIGWKLGDDAWAESRRAARAARLHLPCGHRGHPAEIRGTRFFRHNPGAHCTLHVGGEGPEHTAAKRIIAEVAQQLGWSAELEAVGPNRAWIADVLLTRLGRRPVAVEVQWSPQTAEDFQARTTRYWEDDVSTHWFVGPKARRTSPARSADAIDGPADALVMTVTDQLRGESAQVPFAEGAAARLSGRLRDRVQAAVVGLELSTAMKRCWRPQCSRWMTLWFISGVQLTTRCGVDAVLPFHEVPSLFRSSRPEPMFQQWVMPAIAASDLPAPTRYAEFSSRTAGATYLAQHCSSCGAGQGDAFLTESSTWSAFLVPVPRTMLPLRPGATAVRHRCAEDPEERCQPRQAEGVTFPPEQIDSGWAKHWQETNVSAGTLHAPLLPQPGSRRRPR